jgi:F-type H+-transporting ATPase subunit delta
MAKPEGVKTRITSVMEDPSAQAIARVYSEAFVQAARTTGLDQAIEEFASFVDDVLAKFPEFEQLLSSGLLGRDEKLALIDRVVKPRGSELFTNFLRVLANHDRLDLLPSILNESRLKQELLSGRKRVQVHSAFPLSQQTHDKIYKRLVETLPFQPILESKIDPSLIGGIVIQIGDKVFDSSVKVRLKQLRDQLRKRCLHEIQSGRNRFSSPEGN